MLMNPDAEEPVTPRLIRRLGAPDPDVRLRAAAALGRLQGAVAEAVEPLAAALKDEDPHVRKAAALTLGDIGPAALPALPALLEALGDGEPSVRRRVAVALGELGAAEALAALAQLASHDPNDGVRRAAATALREIQPPLAA
jgi:HEAT repeat protein